MKGKVAGWWNKIFMEIFRSMLHGFLSFSPVLTELCSFWYGLKDLHFAQVSGQSCPLPLKLMTSQVVESGSALAVTGGSGANGLILIKLEGDNNCR